MMRLIAQCVLMIMVTTASYAQGLTTNPLIFERETIQIIPQQPKESAQQATSTSSQQPDPPEKERMPHSFNVEIRPEDALKLDYIYGLTTLNDTNGVMIAFGAPTIAPLPFFRVQQATDVLFVNDEGVILQIYPGHIPMDVTRDIYADTPIKALIYLKAGVVKALDIRPKDIVQSRVFNPPPPLLQ